MSLYNMIMGENPFADTLLKILGISRGDVPRYRDCYLEDGRIVVYTRTGGGNRDMYEHIDRAKANYPEYFEGNEPPSGPWNSDLRQVPGFVYDADDDFDSTFARFYFDVPEQVRDFLAELETAQPEQGGEAFRKLIEKLGDKDTDDPRVARALTIGTEIVKKIQKAAE